MIVNETPYEDPYQDVSLVVLYTRPDGSVFSFPGFYDGDSTWRFRCLADQAGKWKYQARFSDDSDELEGSFICEESDSTGRIHVYRQNPYWFAWRDNEAKLIRSLQIGDRFFASNYDSLDRRAFLDWVQEQGYNTLSIASHFLNRNRRGYGQGWNTPKLWPLNAAEYQKMEQILDNLQERGLTVFPLSGFFGRSAFWPIDPADQEQYLAYTLSRLGAYNNLMFNIAGPEPLLRPQEFQYGNMQRADIFRIGNQFKAMDPFGHMLSVHNRKPVTRLTALRDADPFMQESWEDYACFQGGKSANLDELYDFIIENRINIKPIYAHEVLWPGHALHDYLDSAQISQKAIVLLMAGASINFADFDGLSSSGFSASLNLEEKETYKHDAIKKVWDFFETIPWYNLKPTPGFIPNTFCLADSGQQYLFYLPAYDTLQLPLDMAQYQAEWISISDTIRRIQVDAANTSYFIPPDTIGDWFLNCLNNND